VYSSSVFLVNLQMHHWICLSVQADLSKLVGKLGDELQQKKAIKVELQSCVQKLKVRDANKIISKVLKVSLHAYIAHHFSVFSLIKNSQSKMSDKGRFLRGKIHPNISKWCPMASSFFCTCNMSEE